MSGSPTALAKLGIGVTDPVDTALNFSSFDPGVTRELFNANGMRGTFFLDGNRMIENRRVINPRFSSEPTAPEWAYLLAWVMGGTPTGTTTLTYPWSDTAAARNLHFKPVAGEEWFLSTCGVDNAVIAAQVGGALSCDLDIVGLTHDATRTNMPSLTYDQTLQPFILAHLILTVGGSARACNGFSFTVHGGLDRERFFNSLTLTALLRINAGFTCTFQVPSGDNAAQFWASGITGASATAVFTNPTTGAVLTLDFPKLKFPGQSPIHAPGSEGFITVNATCTRVTTGNPVNISLSVGS